MAQYRNKPIPVKIEIIEAEQYVLESEDHTLLFDFLEKHSIEYRFEDEFLYVKETVYPETESRVYFGDFIIIKNNGRYTTCGKEEFENTYEKLIVSDFTSA